VENETRKKEDNTMKKTIVTIFAAAVAARPLSSLGTKGKAIAAEWKI
jgi:hypothetical protein